MFVLVNILRRLHLNIIVAATEIALVRSTVLVLATVLIVVAVAIVATMTCRWTRRWLVIGVVVWGVGWWCSVWKLGRPASAPVRGSPGLSSSSLGNAAVRVVSGWK